MEATPLGAEALTATDTCRRHADAALSGRPPRRRRTEGRRGAAELELAFAKKTVYSSATLKQTWQRDTEVPLPQCAFECLMLNDSACRIE